MFGRGGALDDEQTIRELEGQITKIRFEQVAVQHDLEEAVQSELCGLGMVDGARAKQRRCREKVDELAKDISALQDKIADLIPKPRPPG